MGNKTTSSFDILLGGRVSEALHEARHEALRTEALQEALRTEALHDGSAYDRSAYNGSAYDGSTTEALYKSFVQSFV